MSRRFDNDAAREEARERLKGQGERSARKSYYPALQDRLAELQRFRALLDESGDAIFLVEWPSGTIADANGTAGRLLGCGREGLVGGQLADHLADVTERWLAEQAELAPAGGHQRLFRVGLRREGQPAVPVELGLRQVHSDGRTWLVAVARDVTERELMRARLAVADQMASIGTLAAGVAHEINNPLTYVIGNVEYARQELSRARGVEGTEALALLAEAEAALGDAQEGARRVQQIVRDLKTLSHPHDEQRRPVDLRRVVDAACGIVAHEVRQRGKLVREHHEAAVVQGDDGRLTQVLINLLVNAAQAIPEGSVAEHEIRVVVTAAEGQGLVEVRDTGSGIRPEDLERIFEPFFTTKAPGLGTGLGLPICHRIVTDHGGTIQVESTPGRGTVFRVRLPLARAEDPPAAERRPDPPAAGARARVLVVDDDPLCGQAVSRLLARTHDVVACTSPRAALERLGAGQTFDAVLCDVVMPDLDGQAFYEALREIAPELARRLVFISGGAFTERTRAFMTRLPAPALEKPLALPELLAAIDAVASR